MIFAGAADGYSGGQTEYIKKRTGAEKGGKQKYMPPILQRKKKAKQKGSSH